jgi:Zn-dependent peptidase ImmA (M78 family)
MKKKRWQGKKIEIGGFTYAVKYFHRKRPNKNTAIQMAWLDPVKRVIWLRDDMVPEEEEQTLIHEIMHAIDDTLIPAKILAKLAAEEEIILEPYSRLLYGALKSAGLLKE